MPPTLNTDWIFLYLPKNLGEGGVICDKNWWPNLNSERSFSHVDLFVFVSSNGSKFLCEALVFSKTSYIKQYLLNFIASHIVDRLNMFEHLSKLSLLEVC